MRRLIPYIVAAACLLAGRDAHAQQEAPRTFLIGPGVGLEASVEKGSIPVFNGSADCGLFEQGSGLTPSASFNALAPSFLSPRLGFMVGLGVAKSAGSFEASPAEPTRIVDDATGRLVELDRVYRLGYDEWALRADILARYGLTDRLSISAGPTVGYRLSSALDQSDIIRGPGNYSFSDGRKTHVMGEGTPLVSRALSFGIRLVAAYDISLGRSAILQPGATVLVDLASPVNEPTWRRYSFGARALLLFDLTPAPLALAPSLPIAESVPAPQPVPEEPLEAQLRMSGLDENLTPVPLGRVMVNELIYRQVAPLLPAVFFTNDALTLPDRYDPLTRDETARFSIADLSQLDIYEIQHHTLDIVGSRMLRNPEARLTLAGSVSKEEAPSLTRARAKSVMEYLRSTWGIDSSRISTRGAGFMERSNEQTEDGRADNRRVELASDSNAILAPVVTEKISREFNPPVIRMEPTVSAPAGVKRWSLTITHHGKQVARYSGEGSKGLTSSDLIWRLDERVIESNAQPLVADLTVEDSTGAIVMARAEVPLVVERRVRVIDGRIERSGNRERIVATLIGFDFDSDKLGGQNEQAIQDIAAMIAPGATVTVTGYTDRIGAADRNKVLSENRARKSAQLLREMLRQRSLSDVEVKVVGAGVETSRFTNEYPEGRMLSRGVTIIVEQEAAEESLSAR
jgi:outer membrane protein OmpA-like peptidoglycan-associated protein